MLIEHYLRLTGARYMADPKIDDLCRKIYGDHRRAINVLIDRIASFRSRLLQPIHAAMQQDPRWRVLRYADSNLVFQPTGWDQTIPPIGTDKQNGPRGWIHCWFAANANGLELSISIGPTSDAALRSRIADAVLTHGRQLGWSRWHQDQDCAQNRWTRPFVVVVVPFSPDRDPDESVVSARAREELDRAYPILAEMI